MPLLTPSTDSPPLLRRGALLALDLLCLVLFVGAGLVLGFCAGGWLGPRIFRSSGGLEELGYMFNGAILGAGAGLAGFILGVWKWPRARRLRVASTLFAVAALAAGATWIASTQFDGW